LFAPLDVVEDDRERLLGRGPLQRLAYGPGDLVRRCRGFRLPEEGPDRGRSGLVRGECRELLQYLDDRPVRDSVAVGEAATANDRSLQRPEELCDEPRLADARIPDDGHQLAAPLALHALPGI